MGRNRTDNLKFQTIRKGITNVEQFKKQDNKSSDESAFSNINLGPEQIVVWRVNNKTLEQVPLLDHGKFYDGDSYLIYYSTNKDGSNLQPIFYHIYLWIGNYSTIDEFTYAAIKATELDQQVFKGGARQHREVQDNESEEFLGLFKDFLILKGGYDSSFLVNKNNNKSTTAELPTSISHIQNTISDVNNERTSPILDKGSKKLYHICGYKRRVKIIQVSYKYENLNSEDVFIFDHAGIQFFQFNGSLSNQDERAFAAKWLQSVKNKKPSVEISVIDEEKQGRSHLVINQMPRKTKPVESTKKSRKSSKVNNESEIKLFKLSDESGKMTFTEIKEKKLKRSLLCSDDVYILDKSSKCFVWVGKGASDNEKQLALIYTTQYLSAFSNPFMPIERIHEGFETAEFIKNFC